MAHTMVIDEEYTLSLFCSLKGQASVNRFRIRITQIVGAALTDADVVKSFSTTWAALYKAVITSDTLYQGATMRMVKGAVPFPITAFSQQAAGGGTLAPPQLPTQTSGLVSLYTSKLGKKYRGRMYVPFPAAISQDLVTGEPIAAYLTSITAMGTELIGIHSTVVGGSTVESVYGLTPVPDVTLTAFDSFIARGAWATQKRRGDYGKLNKGPF